MIFLFPGWTTTDTFPMRTSEDCASIFLHTAKSKPQMSSYSGESLPAPMERYEGCDVVTVYAFTDGYNDGEEAFPPAGEAQV